MTGGPVLGQSIKERIYVGEKACRQCHHLNGARNQFNKWRQTKHALAYAALSKPEAKEIAELSGIYVEPHASPICLGCHTTAYDVEAWERDDAFHFEDGVQCEFCHGAGSEYMDEDTMRDISKAMDAGLKKLKKSDCLVCHKEKRSHTVVLDVKGFIYEDALRQIAHSGLGGPLSGQEAEVPVSSDGAAYAGVIACAECHGESSKTRAFGKWRYSRHAQAYAILDGKRAAEVAAEMGVSGNPQLSGDCLKCHTTAWDAGSASLTAGTDIADGVQCESCHGAGMEHIVRFADYGKKDSVALAMMQVTRKTCEKCHVDGIHGNTFAYEAYWPKIDHSKWQETYEKVEYKTPFNLAVARDGRRLFVACEASNSVIVLEPGTAQILAEIEVGMQPHFIYLSPDENFVYVSNRGSDNVSVVDTRTYEIMATLAVGDEPHEMATNKEGTVLYVANAASYDVSVVDLKAGQEVKRLAASRGPWGVAQSPDGESIYVTNNLPRFVEFRTTSKSEITVIETKRSTVSRRFTVPDANLVQGIDFSPDGDFALITLIRTKNLVPMTRNVQGWIITNGIGILWKDGRIDQLLLDSFDDFFADPTDVVFSKDGRYAFVSGGGVQEIAVIEIEKMKNVLKIASDADRQEVLPNHLGISASYVARRIKVGQSPRGMVVSPDNKFLYVADGLDDAVSVIDIKKMERVRVIDLGGPQEITEARYGERIFHSAEHTFVRQFSCHSCHPDGGIDGITYDIEPDGLGINPVDNRTLRGINDTAPFKWTGKNPSLRRQCGPRLAAFFTRIDPFRPEESEALDRYIVTIARSPNRYRTDEKLTPAQRRGKRIFERAYDKSGNKIPETNQCHLCHAAPYFTNREKFDVGSRSWLDTDGTFDVPHLNNIYETPPYLHDGRANSLEEIWTIYNPDDTHGQTNDLTKDELNDLIEYLKTL
jgi:YVTN family beta-propeller protein